MQVPLYITYTYTAEDIASPTVAGVPGSSKGDATSIAGKAGAANKSDIGPGSLPEPDASITGALRSFSFWASVPLGTVVPRTTTTVAAVAAGSTISAGQQVVDRRVASSSSSSAVPAAATASATVGTS